MNKAQILYDQRRRDVLFCKSCGAEYDEQLHYFRCERCKETGCCHCLKENEVGEMLCEECSDIENDPLIKAAKKAAASGSYHDLHKYIEHRKRAI